MVARQTRRNIYLAGWLFVSFAGLGGAQTVPPATGLARLYPDTPLLQDGRPAAIVVASASDPAAAAAAAIVAAALKDRYAVEFPVVADAAVCPRRLAPVGDAYQTNNLIVVGNLYNNRAIFPLYALRLCGTDSGYPGDGGYEVRTVSNPWGTGRNVLVVGASVATNMRAAVAAFTNRLPAVTGNAAVMPYTIAVKPGPSQRSSFTAKANAVAAWPAADTNLAYDISSFCAPAENYYWTGDERWAAIARDYINVFNVQFANLYPVGHYTMEGAYRAWDMVEESPVFTDAERQATARNFEATARNPKTDSIPSGAVPVAIGSTHATLPMLGRWVAARYLRRTFPDTPELTQLCDAWEQGVANYFQGAFTGFRDDTDGGGTGSIAAFLRWCAMAQRYDYITTGHARAGVQFAVSLNDSLGYGAGLDTYGAARIGAIYKGLSPLFHLQIAAYLYQDPEMAWLARNLPNRALLLYGQGDFPLQAGSYALDPELAERQPQYLGWFSVIPLDARQYRVLGKSGKCPLPPREQCFDKACFRGGFDTRAPFLFLQGLQADYRDANTIPRYTDKGQVWLVHNSSQIGHYYRNALFISDGHNATPLPMACRLDAAGRMPGYAMSGSTLHDYYGTDWQRTIFWRTDSWFMVMDRATVKRDGFYSAQSVWRLPVGAAWKNDRMLQANQGDQRFYILASAPVTASADFETPAGGPPDVCERPFILRERKSGSFHAGDVLCFQNLLVTTESNTPSAWTPIQYNHAVVVIRSGGTNVVVGVGGGECGPAGITADQGLYVADEAAIHLAGVQRLSVNGVVLLDTNTPFTGRIDLHTGELDLGYDAAQLKAVALNWSLPAPVRQPRLDLATARAAGKAMMAALATIEDVSSPGGVTETAECDQGNRSLSLVWENTDLGFEGRRIQGIHVTCSGAWTGRESALYDGIILSGAGNVVWPQNGTGAVEVGWSTNQPIHEVRLHLGPVYMTNRWTRSFDVARSMTNEVMPVELTWSSDGFQKDLRVETRNILREFRVDPTYKCDATPQSYLRIVNPAAVMAAAVRVTVPPGVTARGSAVLSEVEVCATNRGPLPPHRIEAVDLKHDGTNEWVVNAGAGVLLALNAAGRTQWRRTFVAEISGMDFGDINADGALEILVSDYDQYAYAFAPDGELLWQTDFVNLFLRTGKQFGLLNYNATPYGIGFWDLGNGVKRVLVGSYEDQLFVLDEKGRILQQYYPGFSMFQRTFVPDAVDLSGDGLMEKIMCSMKYGAYGVMHVLVGSPAGLIVGHRNTSIPDNLPYAVELAGVRRNLACVITPVGSGVYDLARNFPEELRGTNAALVTVWEQSGGRPLSAGLVADIDGKGQPELITAGRDGFVSVYTTEGQVLNTILLGVEIHDLAVLGRGADAVFVLATSAGLRVYNRTWRLLGLQPGCYLKIQAAPDRRSFLAVTADARLQLWRMDLPSWKRGL